MSARRRWAHAGLALIVTVLAVPLGAVAAAGAARPSPVFVSTVPAMAGVHLEVAGIFVVTGADGTAAVGTIDTAGVSHDVHVTDHRAAGGHKVWLSKVSRSGDTSSGVRLQVGLNVASAVRLLIDPGRTGFATSSLRLVRLHSVAGQKIDVDPRRTRTVQLLARRTRLIAGTLVSQHVTWSVDLVSAGPGLAMTTDTPRFDPFGHPTWRLRLATVHGTVLIDTVPRTPQVTFLIEGATVTTDAHGHAVAPVADLNNVRDRLRLATPEAGAVEVSNLRVSKLAPKVAHRRQLVAALDVRRAVRLTFTDLRGTPVPAARVGRVRMDVGSTPVVLTGAEAAGPALLLTQVAARVGSGWETRPVGYTLRSVLIDGSEAVFNGRQRFNAAQPGDWTIRLSVFSLRVSVRDAILGGQVHSRAVITRPDGAHTALQLGRKASILVPMLVRGLYGLKVDSAIVGGNTSLLMSRDDTVDLRVVTLFDAVLIAAVVLLLIVGVLSGGRLMARRRAEAAARTRR